MENKTKQMKKISPSKTFIIIVLLMVTIIGIMVFVHFLKTKPVSKTTTKSGTTSTTITYMDTGEQIPNNSNTNYTIKGTVLVAPVLKEDNLFVKNKKSLENYLYECFKNDYKEIDISEFDEQFFKNHNLAIYMYDCGDGDEASIESVIKDDSKATININYKTRNRVAELAKIYFLNFVVLDKTINSVEFNIYMTTINTDFNAYAGMLVPSIVFVTLIIILVTMNVSRHNKIVEGKIQKNDTNPKTLNIILNIILIIGIIYTSYLIYMSVYEDSLYGFGIR